MQTLGIIIATALISSFLTYEMAGSKVTDQEREYYYGVVKLVESCQAELEKSINGE